MQRAVLDRNGGRIRSAHGFPWDRSERKTPIATAIVVAGPMESLQQAQQSGVFARRKQVLFALLLWPDPSLGRALRFVHVRRAQTVRLHRRR